MANCFNHPDEPAMIHCVVCGKGVCKECIVMKKFCSIKCAEASTVIAANELRSREWKKRTSHGWIRPLVTLLILALMGYCAYHYYQRNKPRVDKKVQKLHTRSKEAIKEVKSKSRESIKDGQKYLDRDSRYKKDREQSLK